MLITTKIRNYNMEPLSAFAISIAAGIALNLLNEFQKRVDKELKRAFNSSLKQWSVNPFIREKNQTILFIKIKKLFDNPDIIDLELEKDVDLKIFYQIFDKEICKHDSASTYLNKITNRLHFIEAKKALSSLLLYSENLKIKIDEVSNVFNKIDPSGIMKDEYFELIIKDYYLVKEEKFEKEVWPYQIGKQEFVSIFDFTTGTISNRDDAHFDEDCVHHIALKLLRSKMFCIGFYGMGKTTVSKFLFSTIKILPSIYVLYISLSYKALPDSENLIDLIFNDLKSNTKESTDFFRSYKIQIRNKIIELLESDKLVVIFDGLDESIHSNQSLKLFANCIQEEIKTSFLTCRLEFSNFFTVFERVFRNNGYVIELQEWNNKQWNTYLNALKSKYNIEEERISSFKSELPNSLSDLAKRPLFFRMITDLFLIRKAKLDLPSELKGNIASVYYEFINWKIYDDIDSRGAALNKETFNVDTFAQQVFILFTEIALKEYNLIREKEAKEIEYSLNQENKILKDQKGKTLSKKESPELQGIKVDEIKEIINNNPFYEIDEKNILSLFLSSTLFSTISNENEMFKFSHKSFIEYLVAFKLASDIFDKKEIGYSWDIYQTYEVSDQFQSEVERRIYYNGGGTPNNNEIIKEVFIKELNKEIEFTEYSEKIEEVLYYLGKFQIESEEILQKLFSIINDSSNAHPIFIRTSYITLARLGKYEYLEDFVIKLIKSYHGDGILFDTNREIDIKYYGESSIRSKLLDYVNQYINNNRLDKLNILRIFSFFTSTNIKVNSDMNISKILNSIKNRAHNENHTRIEEICSEIKKIISIEDNAEE